MTLYFKYILFQYSIILARIVNAACVLHNIAKQYNVPANDIYREEDIEIEEIEIENNVNMHARGNVVREILIQQYFT